MPIKKKIQIEEGATDQIISVREDLRIAEYKKALYELRKDGVLKIKDLIEENNLIKKNKMIDAETKEKIINANKEGIVAAKIVKAENKIKIKEIVKEAAAYVTTLGRNNERIISGIEKTKNVQLKIEHEENLKVIAVQREEVMRSVVAKYAGELTPAQVKEKKEECKDIATSFKARVYDENVRYKKLMTKSKDEINDMYLDRQIETKNIRDGKMSSLEKVEAYFKNYVYKFDWKKFLFNNILYLVIFLIYVICIIKAPLDGKGNLLSIGNILQILEQSSTRIFYALGVAGLILLGGTDLSIGRMIALGSVTTSVILHSGPNIITFFGMAPMDFTAIPMIIRVVMALVLSVVFCTVFSCIAGFFTAKFKMHPFITTLSTQLVIYGLLYYSTTGIPTGGVDSGIKNIIAGLWRIGDIAIPKIIVYSFIAIAAAWFIWNKTKFGKNMFAVGGNAEAAAVSGISVFWTTVGVFAMAGIFYGCGSFLEAFRSNSSASSGSGLELDAIAACVVGGISFSGGIGKIKGAVFGVFIFTGLTYCLSFLGIDTNLQFVLKGIIIMAAVALDSVKYLKRK